MDYMSVTMNYYRITFKSTAEYRESKTWELDIPALDESEAMDYALEYARDYTSDIANCLCRPIPSYKLQVVSIELLQLSAY